MSVFERLSGIVGLLHVEGLVLEVHELTLVPEWTPLSTMTAHVDEALTVSSA